LQTVVSPAIQHQQECWGKPLLDFGFNITREIPIRGVRDLQEGAFLQCPDNERFARIVCKSGAARFLKM
jgi:hypothetical protein